MKEKEPELQDEVVNINNDMAGTVIAKYGNPDNDRYYLDVRGVDDKIYYGTPMKNWLVTKECNE